MRQVILLLIVAVSAPLWAGMETRTDNGIQDQRLRPIALTNGTIVTAAGRVTNDQHLLIKDGRVQGLTSEIPSGYQIVDLDGGYVYPGLVDFYSHYGMPKVGKTAANRWSGPETLNSTSDTATNANEAIKSHVNAADLFSVDTSGAEALRNLGITSVLSFHPDGVARGTSMVSLTADLPVNEVVLKNRVTTQYSFDKGSSKQYFPVSRMGVVSLLRQTDMDAEWYSHQSPKPFTDISLEAYLATKNLPKVMSAFDWKTVLLGDKVGDELGHQFIIRSGGDDYQRLDAVKETGATLVIDVNFPNAPEVSDPAFADYVHLRQLKHWELAPYNPARLAQAGVPFVITSDETKHFWKNLKLAVEKGLDEDAALRALTEAPAQLMSLETQLGTLDEGRLANFIVTNGPLFAKDSHIQSTWVLGEKHLVAEAAQLRTGIYSLAFGQDDGLEVEISQIGKKYRAKLGEDQGKMTLDVVDDYLNLVITRENEIAQAALWLIDGEWKGAGQNLSGTSVEVLLSKVEASDQQADEDTDEVTSDASGPGKLIFPFVAHGYEAIPEVETLLIKNATVWTNEAVGVLEQADVLIKDGKISKVGTELENSGARVIDGPGLHLTPGIIDEHSHIALDGVNDIATNSSMVRMADVVDSEDVGIYRALAGGVTAAQLLHGSANPIGGQSALIKLRWGQTPEQMQIQGVDAFIKFALGENVKRSSNKQSTRFPQTRMGVEQFYIDSFNEARLYESEWQAYNDLPRRKRTEAAKPRKDLRMDTLVEILNGDRFVTSHSYVQSEINMLMKVAEQFDFRINTFTHILEGYKVADKMAAHGVGGSTFSDWWAYKWEVRYAIPYNAALMSQAGVVTAINSDDAEMLRRLNQEAAKSIRHGGMSEQDALRMVTLNPAKLLHLDDRMGSIVEGKDADVVLWSGHPLSVYSKAITTIVDGAVYFDRERDAELQASIQQERRRLVQKVLVDDRGGKNKGSESAPPDPAKLNYNHDMLHLLVDQVSEQLESEVHHD